MCFDICYMCEHSGSWAASCFLISYMFQGKWRGSGKCQAIESEQVGTGWQDLGLNRNLKKPSYCKREVAVQLV